MSELVPCPHCARHVRVRETACPFCAGAFPEPAARGSVLKPGGRMSRAALIAAGAALLGAAGCDENVATPVYGAPAPDASTDSADANRTDDANGDNDANSGGDATATTDGNVSEMGTLIYGSPPMPGQ